MLGGISIGNQVRYYLKPIICYLYFHQLHTIDQRKKVPIEQRKYKEPPNTFLLPKMDPETNLLSQDSKMMLFKNVK